MEKQKEMERGDVKRRRDGYKERRRKGDMKRQKDCEPER